MEEFQNFESSTVIGSGTRCSDLIGSNDINPIPKMQFSGNDMMSLAMKRKFGIDKSAESSSSCSSDKKQKVVNKKEEEYSDTDNYKNEIVTLSLDEIDGDSNLYLNTIQKETINDNQETVPKNTENMNGISERGLKDKPKGDLKGNAQGLEVESDCHSAKTVDKHGELAATKFSVDTETKDKMNKLDKERYSKPKESDEDSQENSCPKIEFYDEGDSNSTSSPFALSTFQSLNKDATKERKVEKDRDKNANNSIAKQDSNTKEVEQEEDDKNKTKIFETSDFIKLKLEKICCEVEEKTDMEMNQKAQVSCKEEHTVWQNSESSVLVNTDTEIGTVVQRDNGDHTDRIRETEVKGPGSDKSNEAMRIQYDNKNNDGTKVKEVDIKADANESSTSRSMEYLERLQNGNIKNKKIDEHVNNTFGKKENLGSVTRDCKKDSKRSSRKQDVPRRHLKQFEAEIYTNVDTANKSVNDVETDVSKNNNKTIKTEGSDEKVEGLTEVKARVSKVKDDSGESSRPEKSRKQVFPKRVPLTGLSFGMEQEVHEGAGRAAYGMGDGGKDDTVDEYDKSDLVSDIAYSNGFGVENGMQGGMDYLNEDGDNSRNNMDEELDRETQEPESIGDGTNERGAANDFINPFLNPNGITQR